MKRRYLRWAPAALTLVAGLALTLLLYRALHAYEEEGQHARFAASALERVAQLERGLGETMEVLGTVTRLFTTMQPVTREQFAACTCPMLEQYPQI